MEWRSKEEEVGEHAVQSHVRSPQAAAPAGPETRAMAISFCNLPTSTQPTHCSKCDPLPPRPLACLTFALLTTAALHSCEHVLSSLLSAIVVAIRVLPLLD